jgi:DNA-3-methyladenine glycosylase I
MSTADTAPQAPDAATPSLAQDEGVIIGEDGRARCAWAGSAPDYLSYHDDEWGVVKRDDHSLFEKLCLEGFQAGLSWITILRRRAAFREAFHDFAMEAVASMSGADVEALMEDPRIIRNRSKIQATISNARAALALDGGLSELIWRFAPEPGSRKRPTRRSEVPAMTAESTALSKELRAHGFRFVGPTTVYALMQATGVVDDHLTGCWRAADAATPA